MHREKRFFANIRALIVAIALLIVALVIGGYQNVSAQGNETVLAHYGNWEQSGPASNIDPQRCLTLQVGNVNGDGLADLICPYDEGGAAMKVYVQEGTPTGYTAWQQSGPGDPAGNFYLSACRDLQAGDANGDGLTDLICPYDYGYSTTTFVRYGSAAGFSQWQPSLSPQQAFYLPGCAPLKAGDMNGDGMTDLFCPYVLSGAGMIMFAQVATATGYTAWQQLGPTDSPGNFDLGACRTLQVGDANGDGMSDLICPYDYGTVSTTTFVRYGSAAGFSQWQPSLSPQQALNLNKCTPLKAGDVNGDGLTDLICPFDLGSAAMKVYVQQGTLAGYSAWQESGPANPVNTFYVTACKNLQVGDANGDGLTDLICPYDYIGSTTTIVKFASAGGFTDWQPSSFAHLAFNPNGCAPQQVGDVNGDGLTDLICPYNYGNETTATFVQLPILFPVGISLVPATPDPVVAVNTTLDFTATFNDPAASAGKSYQCYFDWDADGQSDATAPASEGSCSASATYSTVGVYTVEVKVVDEQGLMSAKKAYQFVVVYDPSAGFVTGGGWIDSPPGAYDGAPDLTGKASFGFVAKYKKGANVPDGSTQFQFKAGDLNFRSNSYEWLVIAGSNAQFKGQGTINGEGSYRFMLTADDGNPDTFRIQIWGDAAKVYDNGSQQAVSGGSIVIHK